MYSIHKMNVEATKIHPQSVMFHELSKSLQISLTAIEMMVYIVHLNLRTFLHENNIMHSTVQYFAYIVLKFIPDPCALKSGKELTCDFQRKLTHCLTLMC